MLKRIISAIMIFSIIMSIFTISVQAKEFNNNSSDNEVIYSKDTNFDGIKGSSNEQQYGMEFLDKEKRKIEVIPAGRIDIDLTDKEEISTILGSTEIPIEVKEYLKELIQNNFDAKVVYFSTALNGTGLQNLASNPTTDYFTYDGTPMRNDRIYVTNADTGYEYIAKGSETKQLASMIDDVILTGAGFMKYINVVAAGISLLKSFLQTFESTVITPHGNDYLQVALTFDNVRQFTYANKGAGWEIGCVTGRVKVTKIGTRQYYWDADVSSGEVYETSYKPNEVYEGSYYSYPWPTAKQWAGNPKTENFSWKIGDKTFAFY